MSIETIKTSLDAVFELISHSSCLEAWTVEGVGRVTEDGKIINGIHEFLICIHVTASIFCIV